MADGGIGSWMPPTGGKRFWISSEDGETVELSSSGCLINGSSLEIVPLTKEGGVYWVDIDFGPPGSSHKAIQMAPLDQEMNEKHDPTSAFNFEEFNPDYFVQEEVIDDPVQDDPVELQVGEPTIPVAPSETEISRHNLLGHSEYASWCQHCVAGQNFKNLLVVRLGAEPTML